MKFVRLTCMLLISALLASSFPALSFAEQSNRQNPKLITKFQSLASSDAKQTILIRSGKSPRLPGELKVFLEGESSSVSIPVVWKTSTPFNNSRAAAYIYKPQIPSGYELASQVIVPTIQIDVQKAATTISGIQQTEKKKSRSVLSRDITVTPAYGRSVELQMYQDGRWSTKQSFSLADSDSDRISAVFPNDWWKEDVSAWRFYIPESEEGDAFTSSSITVNTQRYYQNPSKYIQIRDRIALKHSGGYKLKSGYMGLKVRKVNQFFRIGNNYWPRYTSQTKRKVKTFQKRKKIKANGVVDKKTWLKMGFSESSWYKLGAYVSPVRVNPSSTKSDHIEAMIRTAKKYLGSDYVVGASGSPSQGADCSGLIMQGLYAAGVDPYPVSCVRHSKAGYEFESRNLWKSKKLKTVPYTKKRRGDLIFYRGRSGAVIHVAIYLGKGKVIESWPNKVVVWPVKNGRRNRIKGVKRVFN